MGMYLKQEHRNSQLHERLASELDVRLSQKRPHKEASPDEANVSLRWVLFAVLTTGGFVAIVLALLQRQDPKVIGGDLNATVLALLGCLSIVAGCISLAVGRHHKGRHAS